MKSFVHYDKPLLTVMLKSITPETVLEEIEIAHECGAEAFGLQAENMKREYHTADTFQKIFDAAGDKPFYITNYKLVNNEDLPYDVLAEELLQFAEMGATLCDVPGDMYCKHPEELTDDAAAIEKQMKLVSALHQKGAEVVISSHVKKFIPADRVIEIAKEHERRGADISKIVTAGDTAAEQIENLRITNLLQEKIGIPYLYLSGGSECRIHRRIGILLGCCMSLCVCKAGQNTNPQPYIVDQRNVRDNMDFKEKTE